MDILGLLREFFRAITAWLNRRSETQLRRDVIRRAAKVALAHKRGDEFDEAIANNDIGSVESMLRGLRRRPRYPKPDRSS